MWPIGVVRFHDTLVFPSHPVLLSFFYISSSVPYYDPVSSKTKCCVVLAVLGLFFFHILGQEGAQYDLMSVISCKSSSKCYAKNNKPVALVLLEIILFPLLGDISCECRLDFACI